MTRQGVCGPSAAVGAAIVCLCLLVPRPASPQGAVGISKDGTRLLAPDGAPLTLRGANWGWWGCVEPADARLIRAWGGNLIRIAFEWPRITTADGELGGEGLALLDSMCQWAEDAGVWFIVDCHVPPGGANPWPSSLGGRNQLWRDTRAQEQFVRMWSILAQRYRKHRRLLAYELMNEPLPPTGVTLPQYRDLCLRLIDAIRAADPDRLIVVTAPDGGNIAGLTEALLLPRPRLVYTFHLYAPSSVTHEAASYPGPATLATTWVGNSPEAWGASGDADWVLLEKTFRAPGKATHGAVMLRSDTNRGEAWFDDVTLECNGEPVPLGPNTTFSESDRSSGWRVERQTAGTLAWDPGAGHAAPGSLRISGTDSYNAWTSQAQFAARPGATYTLRCWVMTRAATGWTYPSVAWFARTEEPIDRAWLERQIRHAQGFSRRHHVPVYCGEFGCSQGNPDGSGIRWVHDVAEVLSRLGIPWTYWNWRETTGRGSMGVWMMEGGRYTVQEPLARTLRAAWSAGR